MLPFAIDLTDKLAAFTDLWQPKIIAKLNDYHVKLAKIQGDFVWHSHAKTDELFLVLQGEMAIEFRDGVTQLAQGQLCIVPRGVEHRPSATRECHILLLEPAGTRNTGDLESERRAPDDVWI
jgi:mannose-6-phosphate isomerase-like protein (cupin superfamily)